VGGNGSDSLRDVPLLSPETLIGFGEEIRAKGGTLAILTAELSDRNGYGRVIRDGQGRVVEVVGTEGCQ